MSPRFFPVLLMVLNVCAAAVYFSGGEWKRGGYWLCAAGINFFATI